MFVSEKLESGYFDLGREKVFFSIEFGVERNFWALWHSYSRRRRKEVSGKHKRKSLWLLCVYGFLCLSKGFFFFFFFFFCTKVRPILWEYEFNKFLRCRSLKGKKLRHNYTRLSVRSAKAISISRSFITISFMPGKDFLQLKPPGHSTKLYRERLHKAQRFLTMPSAICRAKSQISAGWR